MSAIIPGSSVERLSFDSDLYPAAERLERYRAANAGGAEAIETGPEFRAVLRRWRLDRVVLHERRLNDVLHELVPARMANGFQHFMLTLVCEGSYEVDVGRGFSRVMPGSMILLDMTCPMRSRAGHARLITTSLAREMFDAAAGDVGHLHGMVLADEAGLLADFLLALAGRIDSLPGSAGIAVSRTLAGLIELALDQHLGRPPRASSDDAQRLARVRLLIDRRLGDPNLMPETVAADTGLSRATLYRLFKPWGGLVAYIRKRRLDRVRVALSDPRDKRPFAEIALDSGFISESHCSRMFAKRFGVRPGEYRAETAELGPTAASRRRLGYLFDELK